MFDDEDHAEFEVVETVHNHDKSNVMEKLDNHCYSDSEVIGRRCMIMMTLILQNQDEVWEKVYAHNDSDSEIVEMVQGYYD